MGITDKQRQKELAADAITAAVRAGAVLMELFGSDDYAITMKSDNSPYTFADKQAHDEIKRYLSQTRIPVMSEEGRDVLYEERKAWDIYWLIDPLDGTRQFIKNKKEFTVNIALIINNYPALGIVYAPAYNELYLGCVSTGSFKIERVVAHKGANFDIDDLFSQAIKLPSRQQPEKYTILASTNHTNHPTLDFIEAMQQCHSDVEVISMASSLKMCVLADGKANVYARHADTYEWDTAAAQAILEGAGYAIKSLDNNKRLVYNKESLINPWFICEKNGNL